MTEQQSASLLSESESTGETGLRLLPELYLSWTSFTRVTLAERLKIPSISKPEGERERERVYTKGNS